MFKEEITKFLKETSNKGVQKILKVKSVYWKAIWICAVLTFLTVGFYQSYSLLVEYFNYPHVILMKAKPFSVEEDFKFPNIKVCNVNPSYLFKNAPENETMDYFYSLVANITTCKFCSAEEKVQLQELENSLKSNTGFLQYTKPEKMLTFMKDYTHFLIECFAFHLDYQRTTPCKDISTIDIIPSFNHLLCLNIKFSQNIAISAVSMTFFLDNMDKHFVDYNSGSLHAPQSSGVSYFISDPEENLNVPHFDPILPPGTRSTVTIKKNLYESLSKPYGFCLLEKIFSKKNCVD